MRGESTLVVHVNWYLTPAEWENLKGILLQHRTDSQLVRDLAEAGALYGGAPE